MAPQCGSLLLIIRFAFLEARTCDSKVCASAIPFVIEGGTAAHFLLCYLAHTFVSSCVDPLPVRPCALATVVAGKSPASFLERAAVIATDNSL